MPEVTAALEWLQTSTPPNEPFRLCPWLVICTPALYWAWMKRAMRDNPSQDVVQQLLMLYKRFGQVERDFVP